MWPSPTGSATLRFQIGPESLRPRPAPRSITIPVRSTILFVLWLAASTTLAFGLTLPIVLTEKLAGLTSDEYSVIGGVMDLFRTGSYGLAVLVVSVSVMFPVFKLTALGLILVRRNYLDDEHGKLAWLGFLGKWSMLDVFIVAILLGAANLGILSSVSARAGIYVYGLAILLSMIATLWLAWMMGVYRIRAYRAGRGLHAWPLRLLSPLILVVFGVGLGLPLVEVEKWLFWDKTYSMLGALPEMLRRREFFLPLVVLVFVIVLPMARMLMITASRWWSGAPSWLLGSTRLLDKWAMLDVYALAMVVVGVKLGAQVEIRYLAGTWWLGAALALSVLDSVLFRHQIRDPAGPRRRFTP